MREHGGVQGDVGNAAFSQLVCVWWCSEDAGIGQSIGSDSEERTSKIRIVQ